MSGFQDTQSQAKSLVFLNIITYNIEWWNSGLTIGTSEASVIHQWMYFNFESDTLGLEAMTFVNPDQVTYGLHYWGGMVYHTPSYNVRQWHYMCQTGIFSDIRYIVKDFGEVWSNIWLNKKCCAYSTNYSKTLNVTVTFGNIWMKTCAAIDVNWFSLLEKYSDRLLNWP